MAGDLCPSSLEEFNEKVVEKCVTFWHNQKGRRIHQKKRKAYKKRESAKKPRFGFASGSDMDESEWTLKWLFCVKVCSFLVIHLWKIKNCFSFMLLVTFFLISWIFLMFRMLKFWSQDGDFQGFKMLEIQFFRDPRPPASTKTAGWP